VDEGRLRAALSSLAAPEVLVAAAGAVAATPQAGVVSVVKLDGVSCVFAGLLGDDNLVYLRARVEEGGRAPTDDGGPAELVARLYRQFGEAATLTKLRGVFSFVLLDERTDRVFAARSPTSPLALYQARAAARPPPRLRLCGARTSAPAPAPSAAPPRPTPLRPGGRARTRPPA